MDHETIKTVKDIHSGDRVWIIGNGPSAEQWTMEDFSMLGGVTFSTNRSWRVSPRTGACFRGTDYHTFVAGHHFEDLMAGKVDTKMAFVPDRYFKFMESRWPASRRKVKSTIVNTPISDTAWPSGKRGKPFHYEFDRMRCVANFAGQLAIALSAFMAFSEIYLVGFDARDGEGHFFDKELVTNSPPGFSRQPMRQWFDAIAQWASESETTLVNTNPDSAITQLPTKTKEEVVDGILSR